MKKQKLVILDGSKVNPGDLSWDRFSKLGLLEFYDLTQEKDLISRIGDAEIIFTNKTIISEKTLEACNIKYIGLFSTGYNVVDLAACKKRGVVVCNVPNYSSNAVAQFTFALILEFCHRVQQHSDAVFDGAWARAKYFCFWNSPQVELYKKTIGLIGFGSIAKVVARIALALEMKVMVYTRSPTRKIEDINFKFVDFNTLMQESEYISIHCPLTEQTRHLLNKDTLALCKKNPILINTARGLIVNDLDIAEALESGILSGYAADVASTEPIEDSNPLLKAKNCILTPHIAWVAKETRARLLDIVYDNLLAYLDGRPQNVVF